MRKTAGKRSKLFAVRSNHLFIPIKAFLFNAAQVFFRFVITVDIHKPVPLLIAVQPAEKVSKRPRAVANDIDAVGDRALDFLNMAAEIVNAVVVIDNIAIFQLVKFAEAVFSNENR